MPYHNLAIPDFFKVDNDLDKNNENLSKLKMSKTTCYSSMDNTCLDDMVSLPEQVKLIAKSKKNKTEKREKISNKRKTKSKTQKNN